MLDHVSRPAWAARPVRLRRGSRGVVAPALAAALALTLSACGDEPSEGAEGFDAVTVSGEFGTTPEFEWSDQLVSGEEQEETLVEGDGAALADGDQVMVQLTVANGFTREIAIDTHDETTAGFPVTLGGEAAQPQLPGDLFADYISDHIEPGMTVGTRFALTAGVDVAFEDYPTAFGDYDIGNADGLVFVADLVGVVADEPVGTERDAPGWAPAVKSTKGVPSSLDFRGVPAPNGDLRVATLIEGDGAEIAPGSAVTVEYLGQLADAAKPFDESFSEDRTLTALVGADAESLTSTVTGVIEGWSEGLVGVPAGSRVILEIPPSLGYGKKGSGEDIPGGSTLYFLIDVLGVA